MIADHYSESVVCTPYTAVVSLVRIPSACFRYLRRLTRLRFKLPLG